MQRLETLTRLQHAAQDRVCSPLVEALKAAAGAEYEAVLEARLRALRIPFATEADLRAGGFARTPVRTRLYRTNARKSRKDARWR